MRLKAECSGRSVPVNHLVATMAIASSNTAMASVSEDDKDIVVANQSTGADYEALYEDYRNLAGKLQP